MTTLLMLRRILFLVMLITCTGCGIAAWRMWHKDCLPYLAFMLLLLLLLFVFLDPLTLWLVLY